MSKNFQVFKTIIQGLKIFFIKLENQKLGQTTMKLRFVKK